MTWVRETNQAEPDDDLRYVPPPGTPPAGPGAPTVQPAVESAVPEQPDGLLQRLLHRSTATDGAPTPPQATAKPAIMVQQEAPKQSTSATTATTTRRTSGRASATTVYEEPLPETPMADWLNRLIAEGGAYGGSWGLWGINAYFTVIGLMAIFLPANLLGAIIGLGIHITISKIERHIWKGGIDGPTLAIGVSVGAVDIGTTFVGLIPVAAERLPWLLGSAPADPSAWLAVPLALVRQEPLPEWSPIIILFAVLATAIALSPERLTNHFGRRLKRVWLARPLPST
ncbi:MAG: hypothetical protein HC828_04830 [Blastochloris sp.]|nr:hypothetical protein [Blastochloris sp.]